MQGFLPVPLPSATLCCVRAAAERRGAQRGRRCRGPGDARRAARPAHAAHVHESGGAAQNPAAAAGPGATCAALRGPAGAGACAGTAGTARPLAAAVRRAAMGRAGRRCGTARHRTARHGTAWPAMEGAAAGMERSGAQPGAAARGVPAAPGAALREGRCGRGQRDGAAAGHGRPRPRGRGPTAAGRGRRGAEGDPLGTRPPVSGCDRLRCGPAGRVRSRPVVRTSPRGPGGAGFPG